MATEIKDFSEEILVRPTDKLVASLKVEKAKKTVGQLTFDFIEENTVEQMGTDKATARKDSRDHAKGSEKPQS